MEEKMTKQQKTYNTIEVGKRIKELRKARSLKQDDLMEVLNLSRPAISNIETGRRNINLHQIKALADFFGVSIEVLGVDAEVVETKDLLERARLIFINEDIPLEEKQDLYEEVMKLYLSAKEQTKK
jgi:transcriptional regulator with XRE-family HTH domain